MIYIVTGKLGSGKSLLTVQRMIDYAAEGRRIAANFRVDFAPICTQPNSSLSKTSMMVLPPIPTSKDLLALGMGGDFEDKAGCLVLDECAQFLNSRTWQGDDRHELINWMLHARKRCWDVFLIVQHERMLDKQIRDALAEYIVVVRRTDRMKFPFLPFKMPRLHIGTVRYGLEANAMIADRWFTRGTDPMKCYDTREIFSDHPQGEFKVQILGMYSSIPATLSKFRYKQPVKENIILDNSKLALQAALYALVKTASPKSLEVLTYKPPRIFS
jgi:hypothetical protein